MRILKLSTIVTLVILLCGGCSKEERFTNESVRILEQAKDANDLKEAVGPLGIFLTFPDNSWMAIRYRDSHHGSLASSAVVLDSDGNWFHSNKHFCGAFAGYKSHLEKQEEVRVGMRELGDANSVDLVSDHSIHPLANSNNLSLAHSRLSDLGFTEYKK